MWQIHHCQRFLVGNSHDEEDVGEGEEEVDKDEGHLTVPPRNWLQKGTNGEFDGHEEVAEAGRQSNLMIDFVANGSQNVLLNVDDEENDDSDEEEGRDEYDDDGFLVDEDDAGEDNDEDDVGELSRGG